MNFKKVLQEEVKKYLDKCCADEFSIIQSDIDEVKELIKKDLDQMIFYKLRDKIEYFTANEHLLFIIEPTIFGDNNQIDVSFNKIFYIQIFIKSRPKYTFEDEWHKKLVELVLNHFSEDNCVLPFENDEIKGAYEFVK